MAESIPRCGKKSRRWLAILRPTCAIASAPRSLLELDPRCATSVGEEDGVYVFDPDGRKLCCRSGEAIPV